MSDTAIETNLPIRTIPTVSVWTELKVPKDAELDEKQWKGNFMPLLEAPGHESTMWARVHERPGNMILATLWKSTSAYHDFLASPSAQLFAESLTARGITKEATHESIDGTPNWFSHMKESKVQLFWFHFHPNFTTKERTIMSKLKNMWENKKHLVWRGHMAQSRFAIQLWPRPAAVPKEGEGVTMIWVHFWQKWTELDVGTALVSFLEGHVMIEGKCWWEVPKADEAVDAKTCEVSCCSFTEL
ncbi:hypothetical protein N7540_009795 [Penicillium herquei]|nr:hypothetical protein N7540_009795 [Penicillium herquei]